MRFVRTTVALFLAVLFTISVFAQQTALIGTCCLGDRAAGVSSPQDPTLNTTFSFTTTKALDGVVSRPGPVAADPDRSRIYVGLSGLYLGYGTFTGGTNSTDQFAVIDNTLATPAQIAGSPFNLLTAGLGFPGPTAVGIPPFNTLTTPEARVYIPESELFDFGKLDIFDDTSPIPTKDPVASNPIPLSLDDEFLSGIAFIPMPR